MKFNGGTSPQPSPQSGEGVMELIKAKAAASANPLAFVPAAASRPEFFLGISNCEFEISKGVQPEAMSLLMEVDFPLLGTQKIPVEEVFFNRWPAGLHICTNGFN